MKCGEIFRTLDMQHDGELGEFLFSLTMTSNKGKALAKEVEKLLKEANEAKDEALIMKVLNLDRLVSGLRIQAVDAGIAVGFVLGKRFEVGRGAQREFKIIEQKLKAKLPLWPREVK